MLKLYINLLTPSLPSPAIFPLPLWHPHALPWLADNEKRVRDNNKGGDGPSCPSPQKVLFFFVITFIYILTHTPSSPAVPPPPPSLDTPGRHENAPYGARFCVCLNSIYQNTSNVPIWARWWCYQVLPPDTKMCPQMGRVFVSGYIPSTRFSPSLQPDTKSRPISTYIPSPP